MDARRFEWHRRPWGAPLQEAVRVDPAFERLHLYDGGVYDNMGLEPFFDVGRKQSKVGDCFIVCSDAGAPLAIPFSTPLQRSTGPVRASWTAMEPSYSPWDPRQQQLVNANSKGQRKPLNVVQRDAAVLPFDVSDEVSVETRFGCKVLLRPSAMAPHHDQVDSQQFPRARARQVLTWRLGHP